MSEEWVEPRMPSRPHVALPPGACDTHAHIFGPTDRFPFVVPPSYPPPRAPAERHLAMLDAIGAARGVLVQTAAYGTEAAPIVDACRRSNGRLRGVAAADGQVSDDSLAAMVAGGIRGLRFCEIPDPRGGGRFHGSVGFDVFEKLAPRMREHGLHAVLWAPSLVLNVELPRLVRLGVPIALDHIGSVSASGISDPAFQTFRALLAEGRIWIKLVACRVSAMAPDYPDLRPLHEALVAANPEYLLWGSDWPYVRMGEGAPDVGHLIDLFRDWIGDETIARKILVDNPARLFGFEPVSAARTSA